MQTLRKRRKKLCTRRRKVFRRDFICKQHNSFPFLSHPASPCVFLVGSLKSVQWPDSLECDLVSMVPASWAVVQHRQGSRCIAQPTTSGHIVHGNGCFLAGFVAQSSVIVVYDVQCQHPSPYCHVFIVEES
mmetsp:Transcript_7493/g.46059  ORF Transcript_7493/g.46059 Transcript_7493/m.46059 type:complete len:131 (-) Transcript_7493:729-1121(-)